ncbi:hypothetical protein Dimus_007947 [Dionaea muscipula]
MKQVAHLQTLGKLHERQVARELNMEETEFTEEQEMQEELNVDLPETNQELGSTEGHDNAREHVEGGESSNPVDPFEAVMGKDPKGRLRLYGRGVTASTLGKVSARSSGPSVYVHEELL